MSKIWAWIAAAGVFIVGMFTISQRKEKWQETAVSNEEDDVQNDLHQAERANEQAAKHDAKAHEIKAKAGEERQNEKTRSILDRWRSG